MSDYETETIQVTGLPGWWVSFPFAGRRMITGPFSSARASHAAEVIALRLQLEALVEEMIAAGYHEDAAPYVRLLDELDGDPDDEPEEDGEAVSQSLMVVCQCPHCGDRHHLEGIKL
jgi:hypothetical protein